MRCRNILLVRFESALERELGALVANKCGGLIMYIDKQFEYKNHLDLNMYDH